MDVGDVLAERSNPILWIAVEHHVADDEPCLDPRTFELTDIADHFKRAEEELVPDVFDGDYDFQFFSEWKQLADLDLGARPRVVVGGVRINNSRNEEHGVGAPKLGV